MSEAHTPPHKEQVCFILAFFVVKALNGIRTLALKKRFSKNEKRFFLF